MDLEQLLKAHRHDVAVYSMNYPDNERSQWSRYWPTAMTKFDALTRPFGSRQVKRGFARLMDDFKPDVVHLNNIHTQLSPIIAEIAHERGAKVIWTIHDMKLLCPRYDCRRNGKSCELCCTGEKINCFRHSCMKNSRLASWIGYREAVVWNRERLDACTDVFLSPSEFVAGKMIAGGFDHQKVKVLNNFIDVDKCKNADYNKNDYYCYVGRLSNEKGCETLVTVARELPYRLLVVGGGPMEAQLRQMSADNIDFVGYKQWDEIKKIMKSSKFLVIPSEWYENNPLTVIEAHSLGTPVLGARIGGIPELIEEGINGMTFTSGDKNDLKDKIQSMFTAQFDEDAIALKAIGRYSSESYYEKLLNIYKE